MKRNDGRVLWTDKPHNFFGLPLNFTRYMLTSEKLIIRKGFLNINEDEIMLYRILDKKISRPLLQRIFGCSTILIAAKDFYIPELPIKSVKKVDSVIDLLDENIKAARKDNSVMGRERISTED